MENVPNERLVDLVIFGWFDKIRLKEKSSNIVEHVYIALIVDEKKLKIINDHWTNSDTLSSSKIYQMFSWFVNLEWREI
jgi:hypothetical protein